MSKPADITPLRSGGPRPASEPGRTEQATEVNPVVPSAPGQESGPLGSMTRGAPEAVPEVQTGPATQTAPAGQVKTDLEAVAELAEAHKQIVTEIEKRIIGQRRVVDQLLVALFARGHTLFVGVPGLAKTLLIDRKSVV